MSFTLATIKTDSGPRAAMVVGDRVLDIAAASGHAEDATRLHIMETWAETLPRLDALAAESVGSTPAELAAFLAKESETWGKLIRDQGIRAE